MAYTLLKKAEGAGNKGSAWILRLYYEITQPTSVSTKISLKLTIYNTTGEAYNNYPSSSGDSAPYYKLGQGAVSELEKNYFTYNYGGAAERTLGTTSFIITDPSVRAVTVSGAWHSIKTDYTPGDITVTGTIENLPELYTKCSAPTSVTIKSSSNSSTVMKPTDSITVNWSGAKNGTNNTITGYDIFVLSSDLGTVPTKSLKDEVITLTTTKTSHTFTPSTTPARGKILKVSVRARGSAGEDYYSDATASGGLIVNQLPNAPTATNQTVKSNITEVTINVTAGAMNKGSSLSNGNIYYSTSSTGTKTLYSATPITLAEGTSTDYYFWTWDGLEFSTACAKATITRNQKPAIVNSSFTGTKCTVNGFDSTLYPVKTLDGTLTFNKTGLTCKITINYGTLTSTSLSKSVSNASFGSLSGTKFSFSSFDPREYIPFGSIFSITITATDSMGEYCETTFSLLESKKIAVADFPSPVSPYYSNGVEGTTSNHFYDRVIFYYNYDSYFTGTDWFKCSVSGATPKIESITNDGTQFIISINVGQNLTPGTTYTFNNSFSKKNKTSSISSYSLVQCPSFNATPINTVYLRPFTDGVTGQTSFEIRMSKGSSNSTLDAFETYYDLDLFDENWCQTYIKYNGKEVLLELNANLMSGYGFGADYFYKTFAYKSSVIYDLLEEFSFNKNSSYSASIVNKITNRFGKVQSFEASVLTINYNEMNNGGFKISGAPTVKILYNDSLYDYPSSLNAGIYTTRLSEGLTLAFVPTVTTYNYNELTYEIQRSRNSTGPWESYNISDNKISFTNNSGFGTPTAISFTSLSNLLKLVIGELTEESVCYFRIGLKISGYDTVYSEPTLGFKRQVHVATPITLSEANYDSSGKLNLKYQYDYFGCSGDEVNFNKNASKISYVVSFKETGLGTKIGDVFSGSYSDWWGQEGEPQTVSSSFTMTDANGAAQNYAFVKLKAETSSSVTYNLDGTDYTITTTKIYETISLTIYNAAQTISYRANHIGINTSKFDETDVIHIGATAQRYIVAFESENGVMILDLKNRKLTGCGIDIDCGVIT